MQTPDPAARKALLLKLALVGVVLLGVAAFFLRGVDLKALVSQTMSLVREAGPLVFFAGMAILPAFGFPLLAFCLAAGPAFGAELGTGGVLAAAAAAILFNCCISYWLARYAFRPLIAPLVARLGYSIPEVEPADQLELTILLRITPGPPFFVQSYILGLAEVPFVKYIVPSFIMPMLNTTGLVIFGDAIAQGKIKWVIVGVSLIIAGFIAVQVLRRHYAKRKRTVAGPIA